jgi:hypothetical protein
VRGGCSSEAGRRVGFEKFMVVARMKPSTMHSVRANLVGKPDDCSERDEVFVYHTAGQFLSACFSIPRCPRSNGQVGIDISLSIGFNTAYRSKWSSVRKCVQVMSSYWFS